MPSIIQRDGSRRVLKPDDIVRVDRKGKLYVEVKGRQPVTMGRLPSYNELASRAFQPWRNRT